MGGPRALSDETQLLMQLVHRVEVIVWQQSGSKGAAPKPLEPPPMAHEIAEKRDKQASKAAEFEKRYGRSTNRG